MKFTRQQYLELMTFERAERQMFVELFGPLIGLEDEWRAQGGSEDEINLTAFDWDFVPVVHCGGNTGLYGGDDYQVLEDSADYLIERDELGRVMKLAKGYATIALPASFPVKDPQSWQAVKPLFSFHEERIDWAQVDQARRAQADGALVLATIPGGFDLPRELMGDEAAILCYYEQPGLMRDILETLAGTAYQVLERVSREVKIDQLSVHEDLAGKAGPLIGPRQVREFICPYYRPIWELLSGRGTRLFEMDSDGNMLPILEALLEGGINAMYPMEPAAGVDIVEIRRKYGCRLAMRGGIDKHILRKGPAAIREELRYKLQPLMQQGGMVFGLDHRIPNGTPLEGYRFYVDLGRELLGLPRRNSSQKGWQRMAF